MNQVASVVHGVPEAGCYRAKAEGIAIARRPAPAGPVGQSRLGRRRAALTIKPVVRCCANQAGFRRIQVLIARISSTIVVLSGSTRLACQRCSHDTRSSRVAR